MLGRGLPSNPSAPRKPQIKSKEHPSPALPLPAAKGGGVVPSHARQGPAQQSLRAAQASDPKQEHPSPALPLPAAKGGGVVPSHARQGLAQQSLPAAQASDPKQRARLPSPPLACGKGRERSAEPCSAGVCPAIPPPPRKPQTQSKEHPSPALPLPAAKGGGARPSHARQHARQTEGTALSTQAVPLRLHKLWISAHSPYAASLCQDWSFFDHPLNHPSTNAAPLPGSAASLQNGYPGAVPDLLPPHRRAGCHRLPGDNGRSP